MKTITRRVITLSGVKPGGLVQWPFEAFYLYGAVEPVTGENYFLEFSHLDGECFQMFLDHFSHAYSQSLNVMQLDNGRFHMAKRLRIPDKVILLFQPAHSPDVNPIERVWQYIKDKLSWMNVKDLDALREEVSNILNSISSDRLASLTGYQFILSALKVANL